MAHHQRPLIEGMDIARFVTSTISSFLQDCLLDRDRRLLHKEQCAERLAAEGRGGASGPAGTSAAAEVRYSDQAVLANLDWGIDALEEAIASASPEAKRARLDHAERMLQVCAMLEPDATTAGVPNSYLSAWAHLHLALLWRLRDASPRSAALHALEVFDVEPFFARVDFAPELWKALFLPHMSSIVGWYAEERHRVLVDAIPDPAELSLTIDAAEQLFDQSLLASVRPDQAERLRELERRYGESLDRNTRMYARYYKDVLNHDPLAAAAGGKKGVPVLPPIAEPPMTPLHEVSRLIPDFVKFGPILPRSAGFLWSGVSDPGGGTDHHCSNNRLSVTPNSAHGPEGPAKQMPKGMLFEEDDMENEYNGSNGVEPTIVAHKAVAGNSTAPKVDKESIPNIPCSGVKDQSSSRKGHSPVDSPTTSSPKVSSPKLPTSSKQQAEQILRLSSNRLRSPPKTFSPTESPGFSSPEFSCPKQAKFIESIFCHPSSHSKSVRGSPDDLHDTSVDTEDEVKSYRNSFSSTWRPSLENANHVSNAGFHSESEEEQSQSSISVPTSERLTPRIRPPKDFVCPITKQLFHDPVTLETGQTFERRAIQEWLKRGNTTCPITRQILSSAVLPKTNYVLKRLITSWTEQNPDLAQEFSYSETPNAPLSPISFDRFSVESITMRSFGHPTQTGAASIKSDRSRRFTRAAVSKSPTSVISQAASETLINGLKPYTNCLCTSEDLKECEAAVMKIARTWKDAKGDPGIHAFLSKPMIINGFVEILSASTEREALRASIYVLSDLVFADESVGETLSIVNSDFDCLAALLTNGLAEAAILMYQLKPTFSQLSSHDLVASLVQVIMCKDEPLDDFQLVMEPKDAAIALLEQILSRGDENDRSHNALTVISENGLPALIKCLDRMEGRLAIVSILLNCMHADKSCRYLIANRAELAPVLEIFHSGDDSTRSICIDFLSELLCLNRRTFCNQMLQIIKDEGAFSTMHTFLVYLQMAPMEQQTAVASLLLQLDLLVEPRKMSIYREEAIDTIIEALHRKEFPVYQTIALDSLLYLSGRLTASGKPLTEAWLLKIAGVDRPYHILVKEAKTQLVEDALEEEEKAVSVWEKRVAYALCNHENGAIFKALEECFRSNSLEMAKSCLVVATWLVHMLDSLPDTGVRTIASQSLLNQFINVLQSSRNFEEKVLATLALKCFISDPDALKGLETHAKLICKPLRKLKRSAVVVADTLKAIMNMPCVDATEFLSCTELFEMDSSANGEVLSLLHSKGRLFSGHSDGTIKVWDAGRRTLKLIQQVHDHSKAVTCLYIPFSGGKLYSGSNDKTIRVWMIQPEGIHSIQVHDVKEAVHCFSPNSDLVCFASQGTGVKVYNWSGAPRHVNFSRTVKCLAMTENYLYCGCTGYCIQEVDLSKCTSNTFFSGTRKLLGKQTIHALCIEDGVLFAGGSSVDGMAGKAFSLSRKEAIGSFTTGFDIHSISVNDDFVFTGTKVGIIEVWLRERLTRVASMKLGGGANARVSSMATDSDGEMLFAGSSDGKIQVWSLD